MGYDEDYQKMKEMFGGGPEPILKRHADRIDRSRSLLDIGAGQGRHTLYLARAGCTIEAIDPSRVACGTIAAAAERERLPVTAHHSSFEEHPPGAGPYSAVLLFGLLQILTREKIGALIEKIDGWLAPDGLVFVIAWTVDDPVFPNLVSDWTTIGRNSFSDGEGEVRTYFDRDEILTLFPRYEVIEHREEIGPLHRHGDGPPERHGTVQAVFRRTISFRM